MKKLLLTILFVPAAFSTRGAPASHPPAELGPGRKYTTIQRVERHRLEAVQQDRLRYSRTRRPTALATGYRDYRAILHAHAEDSEHTGGTRAELLKAAKHTSVDIIMYTDHATSERDYITQGWRGLRDGVLFIPGAESEGFLAYPVASLRERQWTARPDFVRLVTEAGGNIFLSHVEDKLGWSTAGLDGLEIYNHHTDIKDEPEFNAWLRAALTDPARLRYLQGALERYGLELFGAQQDYLAAIMAKWDRDLQERHLTGVAANDCHHNQGFTITAVDSRTIEVSYIASRPTSMRITTDRAPLVSELTTGRRAGELLAKLDFDPYERSLSYVTTHILANELSESPVRRALKQGRAYVAHDWLCDPTGFAFVVERAGRIAATMGDKVRPKPGLKLRVVTPITCSLKLLHNGLPVKQLEGRDLEFEPRSSGVYRAEAWLQVGGEMRPWIYSNPIYLE